MFYTRSKDPLHPYHPFEWGLFEQRMEVCGQSRRILTYIPETALPSAAGVLVFGEDGQTAEEVFDTGHWKSIADGDGNLMVFVLEPQNGRWNADEAYADPAGDMTYVQAVLGKVGERVHYCVHESKIYLFGTGAGGTLAHMTAMAMPAIYAGLATVDADEVSEQYREACRRSACINLDGFLDTTGSLGRYNGDIPLPVWMAENTGHAAAVGTRQYWQAANRTDSQPCEIAADTVEFRRSADTEYPVNQDKEAYRVRYIRLSDKASADNTGLAARAWREFLSRHQRWMADPGGDLRMVIHPIRDLDMEYHTEEIDGWMREWYVYIPKSVREQPDKPVPLVFALHGMGCNGEIYMGNSGWYQVAEERGFLVVHPSAITGTLPFKLDPGLIPLPVWNFLHDTPNGPDEFHFFRVMLERTAAKYAVDRGRIYATGHSHGSMMTQALALGMPEMFAAVAPCSGVIFQPIHDQFVALEEFQKATLPVPIWMLVGKEENWLLDAKPALENATGRTIALWHRRNGLAGRVEDGFDETLWETHAGRWHDMSYRDAQGWPMLRFSAVDAFPHATMPEMSYRIWDEFFAHWSRNANTLQYV